MNASEFTDWFSYHTSRFTGIAAWLAKFPAQGNPSTPGRADVLAAWAETLAGVSLAAAKESSRKLASGEVETPRSFDDHPRAVRRLAMSGDDRFAGIGGSHLRQRGEIIDGQVVYRCHHCQDFGEVTVWWPKLMRYAADCESWPPAEFPRGHAYATLIPCSCDLGRSIAHRLPGFPVYDADLHISTWIEPNCRSQKFWQLSKERMNSDRANQSRLAAYGLSDDF